MCCIIANIINTDVHVPLNTRAMLSRALVDSSSPENLKDTEKLDSFYLPRKDQVEAKGKLHEGAIRERSSNY